MNGKKNFVGFIAIALSFLFIILSLPLFLKLKTNKDTFDTSQKYSVANLQQKQQSTVLFGEKIFIIKNFNGSVAVFDESSSEPLIITEYLIKNLPEEAALEISRGIIVRGEEELYKLLEDFSE